MISTPAEVIANVNIVWQTVAVVGSISLSIIGGLLAGYGWMMKKIVNMTLKEITTTLSMIQEKLSEMDVKVDKTTVVANNTRETVNLIVHTHNKEKSDNIHPVKGSN